MAVATKSVTAWMSEFVATARGLAHATAGSGLSNTDEIDRAALPTPTFRSGDTRGDRPERHQQCHGAAAYGQPHRLSVISWQREISDSPRSFGTSDNVGVK